MNPRHLFLGTAKDNVDDMDAKGRRRSNPARGANHYLNLHPEKRNQGQDVVNSKLTNGQAKEIRRLLAEDAPPTLIAKRFGVSYSTVNLIGKGRRYALPEAGWNA